MPEDSLVFGKCFSDHVPSLSPQTCTSSSPTPTGVPSLSPAIASQSWLHVEIVCLTHTNYGRVHGGGVGGGGVSLSPGDAPQHGLLTWLKLVAAMLVSGMPSATSHLRSPLLPRHRSLRKIIPPVPDTCLLCSFTCVCVNYLMQ